MTRIQLARAINKNDKVIDQIYQSNNKIDLDTRQELVRLKTANESMRIQLCNAIIKDHS